ncbi:MAG: hypothetical protein EP330_21430 [Deltaproteobacteria bacterium]|nr:MAG: hypothetical protein EP330_21430 [Deltaproteobacteria bacterium]
MEKWALGLAPGALGLLSLAIPQAGRWLRVARWLAIGLVCLLVGLQIAPESYREIGVLAALPFFLGLLGPTAAERLSGLDHEHEHGEAHHVHHDHAHEHGHGSLTLGFVGLGLHQVFDGLQIGFVHDSLGPQATVAIGLHGAPLVAAFALSCRKAAGTRYALFRGVLLVLLTGVGIGLAGLFPAEAVEPFEPWLAAFVGGVLLHVVVHDA